MADQGQATAMQDSLSPLSFAVSQRDRGVIEMVNDAVRNRRVRLAFQPIVASRQQDRAAWFEGLVRILDEQDRPIPARDFIQEIERHEIGRVVDCLALELGLDALAARPDLRLSVNMSARSIGYRRWLQTLESRLDASPGLAQRLILEITEESAMVMPDVVQSFMNDLQARGVTFALDDFGAGYTSFRYLKSFSFDVLKIDGQFVREIQSDADNQVLFQALVDIGRHFDMYTVAEAVETRREASFLTALGVDCLQGYLFGAPAMEPVERIEALDMRRTA